MLQVAWIIWHGKIANITLRENMNNNTFNTVNEVMCNAFGELGERLRKKLLSGKVQKRVYCS